MMVVVSVFLFMLNVVFSGFKVSGILVCVCMLWFSSVGVLLIGLMVSVIVVVLFGLLLMLKW